MSPLSYTHVFYPKSRRNKDASTAQEMVEQVGKCDISWQLVS